MICEAGLGAALGGRPSAHYRAGPGTRRRLLLEDIDERVFDQNKRLQRLQCFVEEHYPEPIALETAAQIASMEKCAFSRYFSTLVGVPYSSWLTRLRLEHALDLMEAHGEASLTEIAFAVGFSNLRSFQRLFKRYLGVTPIEMKKALREIDTGRHARS